MISVLAPVDSKLLPTPAVYAGMLVASFATMNLRTLHAPSEMAVRATTKTIFAGDLPTIMAPIPQINTKFSVVDLSTVVAYTFQAVIALMERKALSTARCCSAILTEKHLAA